MLPDGLTPPARHKGSPSSNGGIADDGSGLPEALRDRLFTAFGDSTKADGSGLGLYLTRRYVELLGGRVTVGDSALGGAAFLIELPTVPADEAVDEAAVASG